MRRAVISVISLLFTSLLWAVNGISVSQNTIGNGLESQSLNVITKDSQGRLWIGSDVGISVISNGTVTNIRDIASEGGLVMLGSVNSIVCTESVLLACEDRILHYDHKKGYATTLRYEDKILQTKCFLLEGSNATFFDADMRSLFTYDLETSECRISATFNNQKDYNFVKILRSETDTTVIYLADDILGLYRFDRKSNSLEQVPGTDRPIIAQATAIDKSNVIWLSIPSKGLKGYYLNSNYEKIAEYNTKNCNLLSDDISLITPLPDGNLLTCHSDEGVCVIERRNIDNNQVKVNVINNLKNVTSTLVNSDSRETLYATSGYGLISMKQTFIGQIRHLYEHEDGIISYDNYVSAFEEPEGTVILGIMGNGLCRIDPATHERMVFKNTNDLLIVSMCRFDDDNILMADANRGLLLFNRRQGKISALSGYPELANLSNTNLRNIKMTTIENGDIFIFNAGTRHYVFRKSQNRLEEIFPLAQDGSPIKLAEGICTTPYAVYVTYRGSIIEINFNTLENKCIYHNKEKVIHSITSLDANSQGELFFTEPEGLHRYDPRSNFDEILVETWGNGRFMNVAVDTKDRIWFTTTNEYMQLFDMSNKEQLTYSVEDGVPSSRFLNYFSICTRYGFIIFPNSDGLVTVNTNGSLLYNTPPIKVTCLSASTDKRNITREEILNSLDHPFKLPSRFKEFKLEFSANSFNPTYSHLLIFNIYKDDILISTINTTNTLITLPRMDNGNYRVEIRQAYRRGLSEPETILRFKVPKPFLSTVPGVLIALLLMLVFGYTIARFTSNIEKNRMEKAIAAQDLKNREDKIAFLSNIAHELRTPLSLIYNPVKDFLQEKSVDGIDYERMERIFNQVNKMTVMVNMILDSSRSDINKADILIEEVNLNEWINFLLEDYRIDCYGKGFSLKFIMDNTIGNVSIDKRIIETGLSNMVNNAIKYSTSGTTITVITSRVGNMIRVSVKDQGRGFSCDPEELFKRYYRENTDTSIPGYGLGLPYARLQLSLIGGNMSAVNNEDGIGSTFYMDFPATIGKNGAAVINTESNASNRPLEETSDENTQEGMAQDFDTNSMTILFVSPDDAELDAFNREFSPMFQQILSAHNGTDALTLLKHNKTDIVISAVGMSGMDGFELCQNIKRDLEISHIPVILLTSRTDKRNKKIGYKVGADAFIPEPYDMKQMNAMIRSQLGGRFEIRRQYNFGFFSKMNPDQTFSITDEEFINTLNTLIDEHISETTFNNDFIFSKMKLPDSVISMKMNSLLGTDLDVYISRIRIRLVKDKLIDMDKELEDIAKETGFNSVEAMNKAFKKETGKTIFEVREL